MNDAVASCRLLSNTPTPATWSSAQAPGCGLSPGTKLTARRPSEAYPSPTTRGAPSKPTISRCRNRSTTADAHGPDSLSTTSPDREAPDGALPLPHVDRGCSPDTLPAMPQPSHIAQRCSRSTTRQPRKPCIQIGQDGSRGQAAPGQRPASTSATTGAIARIALPRCEIASFSSEGSSAEVRWSPSATNSTS